MDGKYKKFCPNCSQLYFINLTPSNPKGNLPLFLTCGHSMCENCILNIIKCLEPIECKVCGSDIEFKSSDAMAVVQKPDKLHDFFPVNMHMVGEITVSLLKKPQTVQNTADDHFVDLKDVLKSRSSQDIAMQPSYCKVHREKQLEYYCKDCYKPICMDCMMVGGEKSCKNHNVTSIHEVNEAFLEDVNEITPKVDETFRRLTKTAVDIGYLLLNYENDTGSATELINIIASIDQHFSKLFAIAQKHKEETMNIILQLKCSEKDSLKQAKVNVVSAIKKAKNVLNLIKAYTEPQKLKQANLPALLDDAKDVLNTPWYLNKDDSNKEALKITVNEDLVSLINDYVHLEGNVKSVYKLYSTTELSDDVEIPPPPNAPVLPPELPNDVREKSKQKKNVEKDKQKGRPLYQSVPKYRSKSGSVSSLNSLDSEGSNRTYITQNDNYQQPLVHPVSPFPESQLPQQLREGCQELIYISHIVDPHNFYVQRSCHQSIVKEMLREFRNATSFTKPSTNHISLGKTYLAYNKTDNIWQRCRVIGVDRTEESQQPKIKVFYFDFGSIETVSIDRLRLIPASRIQCPYPLALNCSLANCVPTRGAWSSDDSILIQNIIDNKQAVIHIRRIINISTVDFKLECDVTTYEYGVNLANALVFHDRAKIVNPKQRCPVMTGIKEKAKLYMSNNDFKSNTTEAVYITHVVSPDKFYVRKHHLQAVYEKICEDLDQEYNMASNVGTVYLPELGMVCAVNVEKYRSEVAGAGAGAGGADVCGAWARGVVTELPGRARVRVLLPDAGLALLVHWAALRYLHHKFTAIRAIAAECHLAGVTPLNKKWSTGSVSLLKKYEGSLLELQVEDSRNSHNRNSGSVGVTLYDKMDPDNIICINQELIKHKYAISFGLYMFNRTPVEEQVITNKSPLAEATPSTTNNKKITILQKRNEKSIDESELEAKDKGPLRLEAKILHYQSPSLIYISLVYQQKAFNELFDKIQKHYSKKNVPSKTNWEVGNRCCTICNQSQTWRRAVITEIDEKKENAKVFYTDFACIETVPVSSLRELIKDFSAPSFGDAAIMCHLCGIAPAVGEEWPSITKEFLKELLDAYKRVFITKLGNFKGKSMPIEIWVYHTIQGDALEPNKSEWRCLNNKITEQGLAIPDKSQIVASSEDTEGESDDNNMLSFLNITGSVNEWLQLEPVPMAPVDKRIDTGSNRDTPSPIAEDEDTPRPKADKGGSSNVMYISDWLPPEPLPVKEFSGIPTYIDNDGVIYLHDVTQKDTLDLIRKALDVRFKLPDPKAKYSKWTVGEPCVALFFLDNKYYRGRVMEVNKEASTCLIHYIDYGNEELCSFSNLRKSVPLHQIPIQAHKCILNRIRPIGKQWERQTLDYIHKSVVEKQCYVKVAADPVNGILPIELKYDKLWINDHLVDFEMAEYTDGSKALVKKFAPLPKSENVEEVVTTASDSGPDYIVVDESDTAEPMSRTDDSFDIDSIKGTDWNKLMADDSTSIDSNYVTYTKFSEEEFMCNITIINDIHAFELSIVCDDDTTRIYEQLFEDLQTECHNLPPLNGIFENKACVAIFPEDGQWYRASILQFSEAKNQIKVRYIDYGNIEIIPLGDTREILEEWAKLPPVTITAKLYGVQVNPDIEVNKVTEEYAKVFLDQGPFNAKIISRDDSFPLVELRNDKDELIYNKLIEDKIFLKCD
ncbi:tudor domain-containing protein qin isoform X2 [Anticarsia gemmatalis]|uniref:tudor domain-containing protein qin isoform X2 n=1 Tax=Anticarsia gemmatalis TaxID=129554 RepID=UPI003F761A42